MQERSIQSRQQSDRPGGCLFAAGLRRAGYQQRGGRRAPGLRGQTDLSSQPGVCRGANGFTSQGLCIPICKKTVSVSPQVAVRHVLETHASRCSSPGRSGSPPALVSCCPKGKHADSQTPLFPLKDTARPGFLCRTRRWG